MPDLAASAVGSRHPTPLQRRRRASPDRALRGGVSGRLRAEPNRMKRLACLVAGVLSIYAAASAQTSPPPAVSEPVKRSAEEGRPFIRGYAPMDGGRQRSGLGHRPGQTWRHLRRNRRRGAGVRRRLLASHPLGSLVGVARSLAIDDTGRIYVGVGPRPRIPRAGCARTIGLRLVAGQAARRRPRCQGGLPDAPGRRTASSSSRSALSTHGPTVLSPSSRAPSRFHRSSLVDGRVYVPVPESGLNVLEHDTLRPLPGTERLANEPFPVVLRYDAKRLLIGTRNDGAVLVPMAPHWRRSPLISIPRSRRLGSTAGRTSRMARLLSPRRAPGWASWTGRAGAWPW